MKAQLEHESTTAGSSSRIPFLNSKQWLSLVEFFVQLKAVCWKNYILKLRNWKVLIIELGTPTVIVLLLVLLRSLIDPVDTDSSVPKAPYPSQNLGEMGKIAPCNHFRPQRRQNLLWHCNNDKNMINCNYQLGFDNGNLPEFSEQQIREVIGCERHYIAVAPSTSEASATAQDFISWAHSTPFMHGNLSTPTYVYYSSEADLIKHIESKTYAYDRSKDVISSAIIFTSGYPNWQYTIRKNATNGPDTFGPVVDDGVRTNVERTDNGRDGPFLHAHYLSGTSTLTNVVNSYIATMTCRNSLTCNSAQNESVKFWEAGTVPFPNPKDSEEGFWSAIGDMFSILMIICLLYPVSNMIKELVIEKESKLREGMMMMSMRSDVLWVSWIVHFLCLILSLSVILMLAGSSLFPYSQGIMVFLYFFLFFLSTMCYAIFVSIFFSKARTAAILGSLIFFAGWFIWLSLESSPQGSLTRDKVMLGALHPACAFCFASSAFAEYEDSKVGVSSYTWNVSKLDNYTFQDMLTMMFIDCIYLLCLSWYFIQIWQNEYGTTKKWYFIFEKKYWFGDKSSARTERYAAYAQVTDTGEVTTALVEDVPASLAEQVNSKKCVDIRQLYKHFQTATGIKVAVDSLNLTMFSGQITALLGHNGAGKTTTIAMLTGLIPADKGTALIEGLDLNEDMHLIRTRLGVCPQHDILFPDLTVEEHLIMFAAFKGLTSKELIKEDVDKYIKAVGLTEKRREFSKNLSGGQKRKLSVAIAFIGHSRIIFLDEPTSGMDPYSRRFTWNVIRQQKEGRVIVLTTHFMDEADLLGDRIAIMGGGKLKCCGSSLYLKNAYGVGYNLTLEKERANEFDGDMVTKFIKSFVHKSSILSDAGKEISFQLPFSESTKFPKLFSELDVNMQALKLQSYGVSVTTLEEVFLRVSQEDHQYIDDKKKLEPNEYGISDAKDNDMSVEMQALTNASVANSKDNKRKENVSHAVEFEKLNDDDFVLFFFQHIAAMINKRAFYFMRDKKSIVLQYVIPILFVLLGLLIMWGNEVRPNQPKIVISNTMLNKNSHATEVLPFPYSSGTNMTAYEDEDSCLGYYWAVDICPVKSYQDIYVDDLGGDDEFIEWPNNPGISSKMTEICNALRNPLAISGQSLITANLDNKNNLPAVAVNNVAKLQDMSFYLQSNVDAYKATTFGAISFWKINSVFDDLNDTSPAPITQAADVRHMEYFTHANYTSPWANLVYGTMVTEAGVKGYKSDATVGMSFHPFPNTYKQAVNYASFNTALVTDFIMLAVPCIAAGYATFVVRERESRSKAQQLVSGVSIPSYWLSSWLWDSISYIPIVFIIVLLIIMFPKTEPIGKGEGLQGVIVIMLLFGPAVASFSYLLSFVFKESAGAQLGMISVGFVIGQILRIAGIVLRLIPSTRNLQMTVLRYVFMIFPFYALGEGLSNIVVIKLWSDRDLVSPAQYTVWDYNIAGANMIYLGVEAVTYLAMTIFYDYAINTPFINELLTKWFYMGKLQKLDAQMTSVEDEDVLAEHIRVANETNSVIKMNNVKKIYPGKHGKYAVKGVSLAIPNGECFGLLGINGAGKSTTLAMLTGEFPPSSGDAYIAGMNISTNVHSCRRQIGYCPQFDALFELLTAREHLILYARIKGIAEKDIPRAVEAKLHEMALTEYADRAAGGFSGGNKRKLSVAIAMIGEPSIVFLDEPSTGMDPLARRFMWEVITDIVTNREKCSIILTTHSMEECEALCTRVGIMVGGKLRCLGSTQHLRTLYGRGYQIEMSFRIPTEVDISSLLATIVSLSGKEYDTAEKQSAMEGGSMGILADEISMNEAEVMNALANSGNPEWSNRLHSTAIDIVMALREQGAISAKMLANWWFFESAYDDACKFLLQNFGNFDVRERQISKTRFEIETNDANGTKRQLSTLFDLLESQKVALRVQEYSVSQTSLEQIFNQFASQQEEEDSNIIGSTTVGNNVKIKPAVASIPPPSNAECSEK